MKKNFIIAGLLVAGLYSAQQDGSVGINAEPKGATLHVKIADGAVATEGQGIAVPNVTKSTLNAMTGTIATSAMVYVTDATDVVAGTEIEKVKEVTEKGYYYFDSTKWVKLGASSGAPYEQVRGKVTILRGTEATSSGNVVGADGGATNYTIKPDDYFIFTNNSGNTTINFPATSQAEAGRTVYIYNGNTVSGGLTLLGLGGGMTTHNQYRGRAFISNGTSWYSVGL